MTVRRSERPPRPIIRYPPVLPPSKSRNSSRRGKNSTNQQQDPESPAPPDKSESQTNAGKQTGNRGLSSKPTKRRRMDSASGSEHQEPSTSLEILAQVAVPSGSANGDDGHVYNRQHSTHLARMPIGWMHATDFNHASQDPLARPDFIPISNRASAYPIHISPPTTDTSIRDGLNLSTHVSRLPAGQVSPIVTDHTTATLSSLLEQLRVTPNFKVGFSSPIDYQAHWTKREARGVPLLRSTFVVLVYVTRKNGHQEDLILEVSPNPFPDLNSVFVEDLLDQILLEREELTRTWHTPWGYIIGTSDRLQDFTNDTPYLRVLGHSQSLTQHSPPFPETSKLTCIPLAWSNDAGFIVHLKEDDWTIPNANGLAELPSSPVPNLEVPNSDFKLHLDVDLDGDLDLDGDSDLDGDWNYSDTNSNNFFALDERSRYIDPGRYTPNTRSSTPSNDSLAAFFNSLLLDLHPLEAITEKACGTGYKQCQTVMAVKLLATSIGFQWPVKGVVATTELKGREIELRQFIEWLASQISGFGSAVSFKNLVTLHKGVVEAHDRLSLMDPAEMSPQQNEDLDALQWLGLVSFTVLDEQVAHGVRAPSAVLFTKVDIGDLIKRNSD
ncbi:hypothetical protein MIND_01131400 [Mycena indigotica]|uniref:Uncharacterized protein n=1 Tax=Mycena indigotica TaxID=2126181 RepID=A0A8H6S919_9AGAR|nr:uncharacterized protein MIND_01131400 [Mycena indigotica]KAF7293530.1 hypothetical protein MIND_01131400 [Mycena indigotica]